MVKMKFRSSLIILILLLTILLVGCMSEPETFIQGYWYRGDVHFMDQWYFDRGTFSLRAGVFDGNTRVSTGSYQVLDVQDDRLMLELDDESISFFDERPQIVIKLDRESDTVRIRSKIYERILP